MSEQNKHHHRKTRTGGKGSTANSQQNATSPQGSVSRQDATSPQGSTSQQDATSPRGSTSQQDATSNRRGPGVENPSSGQETDRATGLRKDSSDLNFGEATLQTQEEHDVDKNTDVTTGDHTSSNS